MSNRLRYKYAPMAEHGDDWRESAACLDEDPELFFPLGNSRTSRAQIEEAKAVCARCTVAYKCLELSMKNGEEFGVWGGLDEDERRAIRRRNARRDHMAQVALQSGTNQAQERA